MSCANHAAVEEELLRCARCGDEFCSDCVVFLGDRPLCATCKDDHLRDLVSGLPSGLPLASFRQRVAALFVDRGILALLSIFTPILAERFLGRMLRLDYDLTRKVTTTMFWSVYVFYFLYEASMLERRGQTLGKILMKVRVVRTDGTPLRRGQAWGRALVRAIFIWFLQIINYAPATVTREKTCLHDLLARTRVVQE